MLTPTPGSAACEVWRARPGRPLLCPTGAHTLLQAGRHRKHTRADECSASNAGPYTDVDYAK